jgi:hypothetical protein
MMQHVKDAFRYVRAPVDFEDVVLNSTNSTDQQSIEHSVLAVWVCDYVQAWFLDTALMLCRSSAMVSPSRPISKPTSTTWAFSLPTCRSGKDWTCTRTSCGASQSTRSRPATAASTSSLSGRTPRASTRYATASDFKHIPNQVAFRFKNLEHENVPGVVESFKIITREKSLRIAEFAFERAKMDGRKKVTCVHKANIMKVCDEHIW